MTKTIVNDDELNADCVAAMEWIVLYTLGLLYVYGLPLMNTMTAHPNGK